MNEEGCSRYFPQLAASGGVAREFSIKAW